MLFKQRFFYNIDTPESGGAETETIVDTTTNVTEEAKVVEISDDIKAQLQELEELRAFKKSIAEKEPEKTPEALAKEAELENVNFRKYAVENDLLKDADFGKFESLQAKADRDLVFEGYMAQWKEENPDIAEEHVLAAAKEAFEDEYRLNSESESVKKRAEQKIAREAKELRAPVSESYQKAKEAYEYNKKVSAKVPEFNAFMDGIISENTPDKMVVKTKDGETEIDVDVELNKEQKEEIAKIFKSPKYFGKYFNGTPEEVADLKEKIAKKITGFLKENSYEKAVAKGFETGKAIGLKSGSNVGAENSFALQQQSKNLTIKETSLEESNAKAAERRATLGR